MTDRPYTNADLQAEAARQLSLLAEDPDFMGIGERMVNATISSRAGWTSRAWWHSLSSADFNAARDAIYNLLTSAADVSTWAITLGAAGLKPVAEVGVGVTTGGYAAAIQIAADPGLTDDAREELVAELTKVFNETVNRVLGLKPVTTP